LVGGCSILVDFIGATLPVVQYLLVSKLILLHFTYQFCRTISIKDVQASDMRPLNVLEDTLDYLLSLLDSKEHPFEVVHDFIFDRTRSIRQDLTMQNIVNKKAIYMYEGMV
jgi:hypothetical protein